MINIDFEELNLLLAGLKEGEITLVIFNDKTTAKIISNYLVASQGKTLFISTDFHPSEMINNEKIKVIDAYSLDKGLKPREQDVAVYVNSINDISLETSAAISNEDVKLLSVFTISTLFNKNPKDAVKSFIEVVNGRLKEKSGTLLLFSDEKSEEIEFLKSISAIIINIKNEGDKIIIKSNKFPEPLELVILEKKVIVKWKEQ